MTEVELSDLFDAVRDRDAFLPNLDESPRHDLIRYLNSCVFGHSSSQDLFSLVLVLLDVRPACIVSVRQSVLSGTWAQRVAQNHEALTACDLVGQLFNTYDVPYLLTTNHSAGRSNRPAAVSLNYLVSFDEERLSTYEENRPADSYSESGLDRREEEALGRFLDYPEPAVQAYCDWDHRSDQQLLESISDDDLIDALGFRTKLFDALDLDYRAFTKYALPYVVPASAPSCLDRMTADIGRYMIWGLVTSETYDITLFTQVISEYREYSRTAH